MERHILFCEKTRDPRGLVSLYSPFHSRRRRRLFIRQITRRRPHPHPRCRLLTVFHLHCLRGRRSIFLCSCFEFLPRSLYRCCAAPMCGFSPGGEEVFDVRFIIFRVERDDEGRRVIAHVADVLDNRVDLQLEPIRL